MRPLRQIKSCVRVDSNEQIGTQRPKKSGVRHKELASCKTLASSPEEGSTGFLFGKAYKRTLESCNAVKGHFAILHFSHLACCCYAYASLCSDRCNRQRASLLQALARPRFIASDDCNAAPSGPLSKWEATALQALQPPVGVRGSERTDAIDETPPRR